MTEGASHHFSGGDEVSDMCSSCAVHRLCLLHVQCWDSGACCICEHMSCKQLYTHLVGILSAACAAQSQADVDMLPSNAKLTRMPAICYWGMLGTLLTSGAIPEATMRSFAYIVVASSFARGPFQPVALQVWSDRSSY